MACPRCSSSQITWQQVQTPDGEMTQYRCSRCGTVWLDDGQEAQAWEARRSVPIYRRSWFWVVVLFSVVVFWRSVSTGGKNAPLPAQSSSAASQSSAAAAQQPEAEAVSSEDPLPDGQRDVSAIGGLFDRSVRGDHTGRWRTLRTSVPVDMTKYAVSYYRTYFADDDELHFVVDVSSDPGATWCIRYLLGRLQLDSYVHADGEEFDADLLASGSWIASYWVDLETGEVKRLTDE